MTDTQIATIAAALQENSRGKIVLQQPRRYAEAGTYRSEFHRAFTEGGWAVAVEVEENVREGLTLDLRQPPDSKAEAEQMRDVALRALKEAGVELDGRSGGGGTSTPETKLTLIIGQRRMDDNKERSHRAEVERAKALLGSGADEGS